MHVAGELRLHAETDKKRILYMENDQPVKNGSLAPTVRVCCARRGVVLFSCREGSLPFSGACARGGFCGARAPPSRVPINNAAINRDMRAMSGCDHGGITG